ncbi:MAG TPA: DNA repair protein RecN [Gammaproteobacteria bacterium]|nr:DNA repair protein RecN [Gammaproteobacteria bacterium]
MLTLLRINNYAIIDDIEIEMRSGFSVMTGETGAGKSILVDALGLALGDRADATAVRSGTKRAEISLVFELEPSHPAGAWLAERGLDDDEHCSLRRTISAEGRSRAFINNQPVTLKDLRAIGRRLVDIHGQHAHQSLLRAAAQRRVLDASGELGAAAAQVAAAFAAWQSALSERAALADKSANREAELELLRFQLGELEALSLAEGEPESLLEEANRLRHVDQLQQSVGRAAETLYESESGSAYALAAEARRLIESAVCHDVSLADLLARVTATEIELKEAGADLSRRLDRLEADPSRLDQIEARLDRIRQLARRHRVEDHEVPRLTERLRREIAALDAGVESAAGLEARCEAAKRDYFELAAKLSKSRHAAGRALGKSVTARLRELGLSEARFSVTIARKADGREDSTGIDQIGFEVTTNAGAPPGPLDRIASGGELSRIGLALSVVATDASPIPTLVFDEVDAGIGGAVAEVVGRRLREIATRHQVLCVTHLPQVASQGRQHYRIIKLTDGKSSRTQVRELDFDERIEELSRMLGGVEITAATRAHAEEMIRQAGGTGLSSISSA